MGTALAAKVWSRIAGRECVNHENGRPPSSFALRYQFAFSRHPSYLLATAKISDRRMTWSSHDCKAICITLRHHLGWLRKPPPSAFILTGCSLTKRKEYGGSSS